jgi:hypothetical protein
LLQNQVACVVDAGHGQVDVHREGLRAGRQTGRLGAGTGSVCTQRSGHYERSLQVAGAALPSPTTHCVEGGKGN